MNGWTSWVLASSVLLALYDIAKKASVRDNAVLPTLLASTCFGCAAYVGGLALGGRLDAAAEVTREVVALSAVKCVIVGTSWVFTFCALRTLPISIATRRRRSYSSLRSSSTGNARRRSRRSAWRRCSPGISSSPGRDDTRA